GGGAAGGGGGGKGASVGGEPQLIPMPIATALIPLSASIRMPPNFAPASRRSFGHLIASSRLRLAATSTTASWAASAATNESCGQCSAAGGSVSNKLAWRLPAGDIQARPRLPRPAVC